MIARLHLDTLPFAASPALRLPSARLRMGRLAAAAVLAVAALGAVPASASSEVPAHWPGPGQLYVGTNYQPVDRTRAQVVQDIAMMKKAGLEVVRMGDLSWDYYEPAEGKFEFETFDWIMDQMHAAGIKVILDIAGLPAPMWLHHKYPGVDLTSAQGARIDPADRYMDNISDPDYKRLVKRFADTLTKRYAKHPAVLAIGYDNEIGNGFMSYSEADRTRFVAWLKKKYGTLAALNQAWATQRWSRRIGSWDEVRLPNGDGPGPFERLLDLRRYWSDVTIETLQDL